MIENQCVCRTYKNVRTVNQDAFAYQRVHLPGVKEVVDIYAISDGVGSDFQSEIASSICCNMVMAHLGAGISDEIAKNLQLIVNKQELVEEGRLVEIIKKAFKQTDIYLQRVFYESEMRRATLTVCVIIGDWLFCANIGDSPAYLLKNGKIELISEIHNLAGEKEKENPNYYEGFDKNQKKQDSRRLTKCMGHFDRFHEPTISKHPWGEKMILVLGSDGAFGELTKDEISYILEEKSSLDERAETLLNEAALHTGDNQTLIMVTAREREDMDVI
jgi:protein phosphatase